MGGPSHPILFPIFDPAFNNSGSTAYYHFMKELQFREALREAISEEMRRDDKVFLMGEEVAMVVPTERKGFMDRLDEPVGGAGNPPRST